MPIKFNPNGYDPEKAKSAGSKFLLPPAGADVRVTCVRDGTEEAPNNKGTGTNLRVKFEVDAGQPGEGYWLSWYVPLDSEHTDSLLGAVMDGCGIDVSKAQNVTPQLFFGRQALVHVKHETYNGEVRAKIAYFVQMDPSDRKQVKGAASAAFPGKNKKDDNPY